MIFGFVYPCTSNILSSFFFFPKWAEFGIMSHAGCLVPVSPDYTSTVITINFLLALLQASFLASLCSQGKCFSSLLCSSIHHTSSCCPFLLLE